MDAATFRDVRERIGEKTAGYATKSERIAPKLGLLCACCNHRLLRLAGPNRRKDTLYLKCENCRTLVTITDAALLDEVARQMGEHDAPATDAYTPNEEVVRLTNAVNRGLEHPDAPEEMVSLILQGIAARYGCCPAAPIIENNNRLAEVDWNHFGQAVAR